MIRTVSAIALILAGLVWSLLFPKSAAWRWDMVASVGVAVGLLGTGFLVLVAHRFRRATAVLSTLLLWSLIANVSLFAWQRDASDLLLSTAEPVDEREE